MANGKDGEFISQLCDQRHAEIEKRFKRMEGDLSHCNSKITEHRDEVDDKINGLDNKIFYILMTSISSLILVLITLITLLGNGNSS